ncbi:MAG: PAS-domain containing protein [Alphaproteobacteria bacterium]|nr:PAS-domain containing protein [Alphaproteobacteria bacterium]
MTKKASAREEALELLAGRTAFGAAFFDVAAEALVVGLDYRLGGVTRLSTDRKSVELLSLYDRNGKGAPGGYALAGTPCTKVYRAKADHRHVFISGSAAKRYSNIAGMGKIGAACYRGEVFFGPDGRPAGHVFAAGTRADADNADSRAFFRLVSQRVGAEYNRGLAEQALKQSELRTRAAEQRLRDAVESLSDGFALYDADDRLVLYNRKWMDLYGYSEEDLRPGIVYEDLVRLDAARGAVAGDVDAYVRQRLAYRRQFGGSFDLQLKDGRWITIREGGTSEGGIVGVQTDITDRMEAIESLLGEKDAAEQASNAKSEDLIKISHELRTPLNAIAGFGEIIKSASFGPIGNPRYREYAGDIVAAAHHVLGLVGGLLDRAKDDSSALALQEEVVDVAETVRAALVFVREAAASKRITIELYLADDMPKLKADPGKLKQILVNLLANGVKFTGAGGRVMVMVRAGPDEGFVFEIADTGPGIAEQDIDHVLREYGRAQNAGIADEEGTGLGLPLAAALAALHDGALELDSAVGFGTLVTVRLPWERAVFNESGRRASV